MKYVLQALTATDEPVIWQMLMHAAHEATVEAVRAQPHLACYAAGWGRVGDMGEMALLDERPVGAAWLRLWSGLERGFGYVDEATPELALAVVPEHQGRGVGTRLLQRVLQAAHLHYPQVSLNVRADNRAVALYRRVGFRAVPGSEMINRTGGISYNMLHRYERDANLA